jgi:hypothetical protein
LGGLKGNSIKAEILKTHRISRKSGSLWVWLSTTRSPFRRKL